METAKVIRPVKCVYAVRSAGLWCCDAVSTVVGWVAVVHEVQPACIDSYDMYYHRLHSAQTAVSIIVRVQVREVSEPPTCTSTSI